MAWAFFFILDGLGERELHTMGVVDSLAHGKGMMDDGMAEQLPKGSLRLSHSALWDMSLHRAVSDSPGRVPSPMIKPYPHVPQNARYRLDHEQPRCVSVSNTLEYEAASRCERLIIRTLSLALTPPISFAMLDISQVHHEGTFDRLDGKRDPHPCTDGYHLMQWQSTPSARNRTGSTRLA